MMYSSGQVVTVVFVGVVVVALAVVVAYWAGAQSKRRTIQELCALVDALQDRPAGDLNAWVGKCYGASKLAGWWHDLQTGTPLVRNHGEMFMLMVTELAEGFEGVRRNRMDDKLPHRKMVEVELADAFIRLCDYAGGFELDLDGAVREKMAYNAHRADHKPENRKLADGKKF